VCCEIHGFSLSEKPSCGILRWLGLLLGSLLLLARKRGDLSIKNEFEHDLSIKRMD